MDALRKAEQQKQRLAAEGQAESAPADRSSELSLEPVSIQESSPSSPSVASGSIRTETGKGLADNRLPELPTRMEDLDEQFMAHAAQPPLKSKSAPAAEPVSPSQSKDTSIEASPEAARKLFDAKHSPAPRNNRSFVVAIGIITLIAGIGIGGYVWWELQPKSSMVARNATRPAVAPVQTSPVPAPTPLAQPAVTPPAPLPVAAAPAVPPAPTSLHYPSYAPEQPQRATATPVPVVPVAPESPVRVTSAPKKVDPSLEIAYQAFNSGDLGAAEANWKKVLAKDPRNSDALHGMAAIALQNQQPGQAADYYLKALENDPKDALAVSGLLSLKAPADVMQAESRLKTLLAEQPNSPHLNFALGNLFSRSARWADAQQAYFKAHTGDPANPDYLFNLAVSLDQLHQSRLAAQYYQQALSAAAGQPAGFDVGQINARLKALQSALQP